MLIKFIPLGNRNTFMFDYQQERYYIVKFIPGTGKDGGFEKNTILLPCIPIGHETSLAISSLTNSIRIHQQSLLTKPILVDPYARGKAPSDCPAAVMPSMLIDRYGIR